jgi:hypothetical protein
MCSLWSPLGDINDSSEARAIEARRRVPAESTHRRRVRVLLLAQVRQPLRQDFKLYPDRKNKSVADGAWNAAAHDAGLVGSWTYVTDWYKAAEPNFYTYSWTHALAGQDQGAFPQFGDHVRPQWRSTPTMRPTPSPRSTTRIQEMSA